MHTFKQVSVFFSRWLKWLKLVRQSINNWAAGTFSSAASYDESRVVYEWDWPQMMCSNHDARWWLTRMSRRNFDQFASGSGCNISDGQWLTGACVSHQDETIDNCCRGVGQQTNWTTILKSWARASIAGQMRNHLGRPICRCATNRHSSNGNCSTKDHQSTWKPLIRCARAICAVCIYLDGNYLPLSGLDIRQRCPRYRATCPFVSSSLGSHWVPECWLF